MTSNKFAAVTLTFGDRAENHVGMQIIGTLAERGFTLEDLLLVASRFPSDRIELIHLHEALPSRGRSRSMDGDGEKLKRDRSRDRYDADGDDRIPEAYVLVIRNGLPNHNELMEEMMTLDWDKKALMRGRVVNKSARYNLCFDDEPSEPDYDAGRGRIIGFDSCPVLVDTKSNIIENGFPESTDLKVEGNYYYDVQRCGIGYHGDSERKKVIGIRLGASFPLVYQWYRNSERVGDPIRIDLHSGDMYMMSEKASGCDWKKRKIYTLRHAAGCVKYIK
jgi:hypothetical protein